MRRLIISTALAITVTIYACPARAALRYGTASPDLEPVFGTLIDFDDYAAGTDVLEDDYAAQGVASITESTGGKLGRYPGSQSLPNYIGTGTGWDIWGQVSGWDGIIQIDLASPASQIGLGVADGTGELDEILSVYDSWGNLLEEHVLAAGANVYAVITRDAYDISRIRIAGDYYAVDDLQFNRALSIEEKLVSFVEPDRTMSEAGNPQMNTDTAFTLTINVTNYADKPITGVVARDNFDAGLEIEGIVSYSQGKTPVITILKAQKSSRQLIEWSAGDLAAGASASLTIKVSIDTNSGEQTLKSGATATGMLGKLKVDDTSESITVNVDDRD
jgi:hypothetical protein